MGIYAADAVSHLYFSQVYVYMILLIVACVISDTQATINKIIYTCTCDIFRKSYCFLNLVYLINIKVLCLALVYVLYH